MKIIKITTLQLVDKSPQMPTLEDPPKLTEKFCTGPLSPVVRNLSSCLTLLPSK